MRIRDVRAVHPDSPGCPPDWRAAMGQIAVAVETDGGLTGYGVGGGGAAGVHVVRTVLRDLLIGEDPAPVEALWERMERATLPFGRKGLAIMALSGVDLALWDLRSKVAGKPVAALLGGRSGGRVPVYATVLDDAGVEAALAAGHRAVKVHLGAGGGRCGPDEAVRRVERAREAVGAERTLMLDAFMRWDVKTALAACEQLRFVGIGWLEEPLRPDDLAGYAELRDRSPVLIAGGEHEYTARGFAELIERRLHRVLQPDVTWCGGMTELVKIYRAARRAGLRVCPHRGAEPWALHAIAALDPEPPAESAGREWAPHVVAARDPQPLAESGREWLTWVEGAPEVRNGTVTVGDAPGFGVTLERVFSR